MDTNNLFGEVLEQGASAVKQTVKATSQAVSDTAKATVSQITGSTASGQSDAQAPQDAPATNEEVVESLYKTPKAQTQSPQAQVLSQLNPASKNPSDKSPEELANLELVRKELHGEYYQTLVNPQKPEEERATEKVEREEQEEMVDLQKKEMEKPPDLVQRAAQRVEKFPGASG